MPIITCCNKQFSIPYNDTNDMGSEYIKDIIKSFDNVNVVIPIPDKYCHVISNYVDYITGTKIPITSRQNLLLCFQLNTLFVDNVYFKYLIGQTLGNWSYMCNMVYNEFNDDLQWFFFVYAPYDFIPKHLLSNVSFMTQWNDINKNVVIKVNNDEEIYYNNVETLDESNQKIITTYHVVNESSVYTRDKVGHEKEVIYYTSNNIRAEINYDSEQYDGPTWVWYDNDQHTLQFEGYHVNGNKHGLWKRWYNNKNNTLAYEEHYVNGEKVGLARYWYDSDNHNLIYEGQYVNDKKSGLWKGWHNNKQHTLMSEGHYIDDNEDGLWKYWYDNDQHTLKSENNYVNGKKHGRQIQYSRNGDVVSDSYYIDRVEYSNFWSYWYASIYKQWYK